MKDSPNETPRPEYPRPQFRRDAWASLNGWWEFAFDDADEGLKQGWQDGRHLRERILVPFPYQSELSGVNDKSIHEVVWYARSFDVPPDWRGGDLLLHFGAVDYSATVWVNGVEVGNNVGGHVPFSFNISPYLSGGTNRLTVRVKDSQTHRQPRGKQSPSGKPARIFYYCTTGIWQTVWLEPVPSLRIEEIRIRTPEAACGVELSVSLHAPSSFWQVEVEAFDDVECEVPLARVGIETRSAFARVTIDIPDAKKWSPQHPHLYGLRVRLLRKGDVLDTIQTYAGIRTLELSGGRYVLNGSPIFLRMVLDQGYWPQSYLAAPSDDALRADVEWVKRLGFNSVRKHQKIEDPRWLYWCDRLGVMVWAEAPNAMRWSYEAEENLLAEWERAVRRDYNHPSIISWLPVNESMGFYGVRRYHSGRYAFLERIVTRTRSLDPHRPVIDNDGWEHTDLTDVCTIHDYTPDLKEFEARYREVMSGGLLPAAAWHRKQPLFLGNATYHGQPVVLSEVGGLLLLPPGEGGARRDRLYLHYGYYGSAEEFLERFSALMKVLASFNFIAGFSYTQLTDIEQEVNGLLTYDRAPKVDPEEIAQIQRSLFDV
jgi:beta-galactosidase/beta-glucuronidase